MASPFNTKNAPNGASAPASDCLVATPSDTVDLVAPGRAFYATSDGDISVITAAGIERTVPVTAFQILPLAITRVLATGTTIVGTIIVLTK